MLSTLEDIALQTPRPAALSLPPTPLGRVAPETLHPSLWLGHQLGRNNHAVVASGFAPLDVELPGGGWPRRCLTELLLPHPGIGEMRLVAPALAMAQARVVMLFDPPLQMSAAVLASFGFDLEHVIVVNTGAGLIAGKDCFWALEQTLKCGHVGAVLAWLPPRLRAERLRRLQLAAHNHDGVAFVVRELTSADQPSAAPLRLALRAGGADRLQVEVIKRRGPPLLEPLTLELSNVLSAAATRRSGHASTATPPAIAASVSSIR